MMFGMFFFNFFDSLIFWNKLILKVGDGIFVVEGLLFEFIEWTGLDFILFEVFLELFVEKLKLMLPGGDLELFLVDFLLRALDLLEELIFFRAKGLFDLLVGEFELSDHLAWSFELSFKFICELGLISKRLLELAYFMLPVEKSLLIGSSNLFDLDRIFWSYRFNSRLLSLKLFR